MEQPITTKNVGQPCVICGQAADAQATIAALRQDNDRLTKLQAIDLKNNNEYREHVAALQADNRTYINERHEHVKQIEQLQARVRELEQWVQDQSAANLEKMRHTDEMQSRAMEAESQLTQRTAEVKDLKEWLSAYKQSLELAQSSLTQRTAELEAANKLIYKKNCELGRAETIINDIQAELEAARKWKIELCNLTPGGSEFADDPAYCAEWVRKVRENQHDIILNKCREAKSLKAELERVRGLIKALPKVEGEIEVSSGVYNFILLKHDSGTGFLCGQIETEQTARAIAALWKHRQGME